MVVGRVYYPRDGIIIKHWMVEYFLLLSRYICYVSIGGIFREWYTFSTNVRINKINANVHEIEGTRPRFGKNTFFQLMRDKIHWIYSFMNIIDSKNITCVCEYHLTQIHKPPRKKFCYIATNWEWFGDWMNRHVGMS